MEIVVLQHTACETLGTIADALSVAGLSPRYVRTHRGEPVPQEIGAAAGLIVMGGPMGVYEQEAHPFLLDEMHLIEHVLREQKPLLGVCLGSQLLAAALGAPVTKGAEKEIGWHPIALTEGARRDPLWAGVQPSFIGYHWHGDVFELPRGAIGLAASARTPHQAFRYGERAYGFLFHMEVTAAIITEMVASFAGELEQAGLDGRDILDAMPHHLPHLQHIGGSVFARWAGRMAGEKP